MTTEKFLNENFNVCHRWKPAKRLRHKSCLIISAVLISLSFLLFFATIQDTSNDEHEIHHRNETMKYQPAYSLSKGRTDVLIALGVPTVHRENQSYLFNTLESLIENMNRAEQNETLIVVFVAETDINYVIDIASEIELRFSEYCENGVIEVISPPVSYYPDMDKLRTNLNDPMERVKWRSKQNLDSAFIMEYSQSKAKYFIQLEDDILTKPGYITIIKEFIKECDSRPMAFDRYPWYMIDFCKLGFIGKLFRSSDLPDLVAYLRTFFNDQPQDWLIDYFLMTKFCHFDHDRETCNSEKAKVRLRKQPSIFQHVGKVSSLKGKLQTLIDDEFSMD